MLNIVYLSDTETMATRSPLSRSMPLRQAIRQAVGYIGTGACVSITARGITYRDAAEFLAIWSRRSFFQQSQ